MDRVNEITRDCFNALTQIRHLDQGSQPSPEVLHGRLRAFIDRMMRRASEVGFSQQDIQDIAYAVVALADEIVLTSAANLRDFWLPRLLQLQYFNENVAGDNFFVRLQGIRADPNRVEVLRVYYMCLLFGFQGRYRIRGGEVELANITEAVQSDLTRAGAIKNEALAPSAARPRENLGGQRRSLPLILLSVVAVVLSILLYVGLRFSVSGTAEDVVETVQGLKES
ncbi:MAG: DotU family type IV/VI secretion system protein [Myxococcota bacterium]